MRKAVVYLVVVALVVPAVVGCATPTGQRAAQGGLLGAILGAAGGGFAGGGEGAALGALAGGAAGAAIGAMVGASETGAAYQAPQPLSWLQVPEGQPRKRVSVAPSSSYGYYGTDVVVPVIEEQMMLRGAAVYKRPAYTERGGQAEAVDYVVQTTAVEQGGAVSVMLQAVDPSARIIATATSDAFFTSYAYAAYSAGDARVDALRAAAKQAVWRLH